MHLEHAIGAVDGHKVARLEQVEEHLELLLGRVARDVDACLFAIDDVRAASEQIVDVAVDGRLVARDGLGRDQHRVAVFELDVAVASLRHAGEGGVGLALRAGGDDADLVIWQAGHLVQRRHGARRIAQVPQVMGDARVLLHAAARQRHAATELLGGLDDELDAREQRGKGGDDDAARSRGERLLKGIHQLRLGHGIARRLGVGAVRKQQQHALGGESGQGCEIERLALDGRVIDLIVAAMDDQAQRCANGEAHGVGDRVGDVVGCDAKVAQRDLAAGQQRLEIDAIALGAAKLDLDEAAGQRRGIDGGPDLAQHERQCADMVLVAVRDDKAADLVLVLLQIADVGYDQVHPE